VKNGKTIYVTYGELNDLQREIMIFVQYWVKTKKTTVPLKEIIKSMNKKNKKTQTVIKSTRVLVLKGYIRRSLEINSRRTSFVQVRSI